MSLLHSIKKKIIKKIVARLLQKLIERRKTRMAQAGAAQVAGAGTEPGKVLAPVGGAVIEMADVPDDIFGQNDIGGGCGIWPRSGELVSPVVGTIATTSLGAHTVVITTDDGLQLLIHVGSSENDTGEKSAQLHVETDQHVEVGDALMSFTLAADAATRHDQFVIMAILNSADYARVETLHAGDIAAGHELLGVSGTAAR